MRILQVVHGYPPRESAGTEQHARALTDALRARGHEVHVLAATRAPGRDQYACIEAPGLTRVVQNVPARPLAAAERDAAIEAITARVEARVRPDVVHVHHLQFLSVGLRFDAPVVYTLHDGWSWCPAGGVELRPDGAPCAGPHPDRCGPCAAAWAPVLGRRARALLAVAGAGSRWFDPDRLHRLYQRAPAGLRLSVHRGRPDQGHADDVRARADAFRAFAAAAVVTAPSAFLAERATGHGLGAVRVIPHGCDLVPLPRVGGGPLLFLGSIARHKGPDRVVRAWRAAFPAGDPPLVLHGPTSDPALALGHPLGGPLDRAGVRSALAGARALVMASRWAENAPLVLLEARAAGCPVVAPATGGVPELVEHGVDGLLFDPQKPGALAGALRAVVARSWSPRPPRRLADQVDAYLALYQEAVS